MALYLVVAIRGANDIKGRLEGVAPKHFPVKDDVWLATFDGTPRELSDKLGIHSGETGSGIVVAVSAWGGRAPKDVWDWLKANGSTD